MQHGAIESCCLPEQEELRHAEHCLCEENFLLCVVHFLVWDTSALEQCGCLFDALSEEADRTLALPSEFVFGCFGELRNVVFKMSYLREESLQIITQAKRVLRRVENLAIGSAVQEIRCKHEAAHADPEIVAQR